MIIIILILTTTTIIIIIAIMIIMIKTILIIVVVIIINSPFYLGDFSTGSTTAVNIYLFKVTNSNIRKRYEICSKLTINTPERHQQLRSGVFIVNFEHILLFFSSVSIVDFEQVILAGLWRIIFAKKVSD